MKKVALITTNKILAQSLSVVAKSMPDLNFELLLLLNSQQALLDAEVFEIDVALIDVMDGDIKFIDEKFNHLGCDGSKVPERCIIYHFFAT